MILIGSLLIKYGVDLEKNIRPVYSYKIKKDDNYEILLKPNNFYMTKTLPSGGYYVSNSVNSYMIDLQYYFSANKKANIESNYNIVANLVGTVKDKDNLDKEVWNRSFTLHDNTQNRQENIDKFGINEQVNIDYEYYKNLAHEFEKNYDITMDTVLKVRFNIYCNINLSKLNANNKEVEDYIELDIPITKTITEIKQNYQNEVSEDIKPNINHLKLYKFLSFL